MIRAYYNENDRQAAEWLRQLISDGMIPAGDVDDRGIEEVTADDLHGYTQCHFFAGIGGWSRALSIAGWPTDAPVWTGSCPCQPFSSAGQRKGTDDKRHLWPEFLRLIGECSPAIVFGEQVASKDGREWLAGVRADLEALGYAVGASDLCAAGAGAPHIRQRLWWVAHTNSERFAGRPEQHGKAVGPTQQAPQRDDSSGCRCCGGVEHAASDGREQGRSKPVGRRLAGGCGEGGLGDTSGTRPQERGSDTGVQRGKGCSPAGEAPELSSDSGRVGNTGSEGGGRNSRAVPGTEAEGQRERQEHGRIGDVAIDAVATDFWRNAEWIPCSDGKARRIEPGTFPLAHGLPGRVGLLRGYGNAIVPQVAAEFVAAFMDVAK